MLTAPGLNERMDWPRYPSRCRFAGTSSTERVSFRQINKKTGNRLRQQLVDEVTREPVEGADKGRGYEYAKNTYIPVDDDELDAIAIESNHSIEIDSFVPRAQIDERYLDSPYYITPDGQVGQDAFAVIREAMRGKGMVALARVVLAKRERVITLQPWDRGLMGTTLRYPYEMRDAKEYFDDLPNLKVAPDMLKLAEHILQSKAADFVKGDRTRDQRQLEIAFPIRTRGSHGCLLGLQVPPRHRPRLRTTLRGEAQAGAGPIRRCLALYADIHLWCDF